MIPHKIKKIIKKLIKDESGGSTIESGLLIALSMILFLLLVSIAENIYSWVESTVNNVLNFNNFGLIIIQ